MRALLAALFTAVLLGVPAVASAADPVAEGLRFESDITYRLEPDAGRVRVSMDIALTNQTPDQGAMYFYFDRIAVPALREATNISAGHGGGTLRVDVAADEEPALSVLTVWLPGQLRYGQTQRVRLEYDLPDHPPRSDSRTRANAAYASFDVFPFGDPGLTSVTVVVPDDYSQVDVGGVPLTRQADDDGYVYRDTAIVDPWDWWARVAARNDDLLEERPLALGGGPALLRYWPGDEEWADFVAEVATAGVPVLEELTGLAWPVSRELQIVESSAPDALGYLGWYDSVEHVVEVGDGLDAQLVLHELSHVWFNGDLVEDRWVAEGLAELYSHAALERIEGSAPAPEEAAPDDSHALPLGAWVPTIGEPDDTDWYVYRTAWWLFDELLGEIGEASLADVLTAADASEIPYRGSANPEPVPGRVDWRRVLDLLEEVGGSRQATELFEGYVLPDDELGVLADRAEARASYAELAAAGGDWAPPLELRRTMTLWQFSDVDRLVEEAETVLAARDEVLAVTAGLGVDELPALRDAYEGARNLAALAAEAGSHLEVAAVLAEAGERTGGVEGVLSRLGLVGARVPDRLADAAAALASGDVDGAGARAGRVLADTGQSTAVGAVLVAQVLAGAGLAWPLRRLRTRTPHGAGGGSRRTWPSR